MANSKSPPEQLKGEAPNKVELIKDKSNALRGDIAEELADDSKGFGEADKQLLKFHGLYQQENRDQRKAGRANGAGAAIKANGANGDVGAPSATAVTANGQTTGLPINGAAERVTSFMLRTRLPGGNLTAEQYLVHDDLATLYGNNTLRITTRQCFQFHGLLKGDLKPTLRALNETLVTSLGACGDVVRNVVCCPAPIDDSIRTQIHAVTRQISEHLLPHTRAYHEIWLDNERVYDGEKEQTEEPIYGKTYLPRKFKIAIAYPGDNCVDVYTQDIGLVAIVDEANPDLLRGFNVLVGGGMGMNHTKADTFPRLGDPLGYITPEQTIAVVEQTVLIQRDYGNRTDRKQARMKYLIHNWGIERFRAELEARLGYPLQPFAVMPPLKNELHLGWHAQGGGRWFLGISVENGRIADNGNYRLRSGLRRIIEAFRVGVRLTPNQDILLINVADAQRPAIDAILSEHGVAAAETLSNIQLFSLACVALPTCGLAVAEAERALPEVINELESEVARLGLDDQEISVRMTGCPNGCARPYVADIGFVGRSMDQYLVLVGGRNNGTRLNVPYKDLVRRENLVHELRPLLTFFRDAQLPDESFGDFCVRVGVPALLEYASNYLSADAESEGIHGHSYVAS